MAWEAIDSAGWIHLIGKNLGKVCFPIDRPEGSLLSMQVFHEDAPETVFHVKPVDWPVGVIHLRTEAVMLGTDKLDLVNDANRNMMFGRAFWVSDPNVPDLLRYVVAEAYIAIQNLDASAPAAGAVFKALEEQGEVMGMLAEHGTVMAEAVPDERWIPDPAGMADFRWWDGRAVTDMVSNGSQSWNLPMLDLD